MSSRKITRRKAREGRREKEPKLIERIGRKLQKQKEFVREETEVQEEVLPFEEEMMQDDASRLIEGLEKTPKLETKKIIKDALQKENDDVMIEFAVEYYNESENSDKFTIKTKDKAEQAEIALKYLGGRNSLRETLKENDIYYKKITRLNLLRQDLKKEIVPRESQFLILNRLNSIAGEVKIKRDNLSKKLKSGEPETPEISDLKEKFEGLSKARIELIEKLGGKNVKKEAIGEVDKKKEIEKKAEEIKGKRENNEPGYEWKKIDTMLEAEGLKTDEDRAARMMEWDKEEAVKEFMTDPKKASEIAKKTEKAIKEFCKKPNSNIEDFYEKLKERFVEEAFEKEVTGKTKHQLKRIEMLFERNVGKEKAPQELKDLIKIVYKREGWYLKRLSGNWLKDEKYIKKFLQKKWGIKRTKQSLRKIDISQREQKIYHDAFRDKKKFSKWFINFLSGTIEVTK